MGNIDSFPLISQAKSAIEAISGDLPGALATQQHFLYNNTFPLVSQLVSAGLAIWGNVSEAADLQTKFALDLGRIIDAIPIAGHIKGGAHYLTGDDEGGECAMISSSRSTGISLGGAIGKGIIPAIGAIIFGLFAAVVTDGIITGSLQVAHNDNSTVYGYMNLFMGDSYMPGQWFDLGVQVGLDSIVAFFGGTFFILFAPSVFGCCTCLFSGVRGTLRTIGSWFGCYSGRGGKAIGLGVRRGYQGLGTRSDLNNHANQLNPNNLLFWKSRGYGSRPQTYV